MTQLILVFLSGYVLGCLGTFFFLALFMMRPTR